jgi:hypothetical protein
VASNQTTIKTGALTVDTRGFADFAKALRKSEPALSAGLKTKLRAAGQIVADIAKAKAGAVSHSIPASIKVRVSGATISVVAGGAGVPLGGLFELGNAGHGGGGSTFRHPVFGDKAVWADQPMHPYLGPAVEEGADKVEAAALAALDEAVHVMIEG